MENHLTSLETKPVLTGVELTRICQNMKAIAPRSYEKTFHGMDDESILGGLMICLSDLTQEQIMIGLNHIRDMGWVPDPAMLRRWCLGQFDFNSEKTNKVEDSYHGANAALVNILDWLTNKRMPTNAEKEAYNRCYSAFNNLTYDGSANATYLAHQAFRDNYKEVVREFSQNGIYQAKWEAPKAIDEPARRTYKTVRKDYLSSDLDPDILIKKKEYDDRVNFLVEQGMSLGNANLQAMRERLKGSYSDGSDTGLPDFEL